jgi:phosphoribosylamine---glycine ligase
LISEGLKVLVVGGGGREHALCWKLAQSPRVSEVYVAPGNAGTAAEPKARNVAIASEDLTGLLGFAVSNRVDLTVVGPEGPLCAGIVDDFEAAGLACLGPRRAGAALEGSKSYAKGFMRRHAIPTAAGVGFSDLGAACAYLLGHDLPLVVKADGLCAGKGVVIAHTRGEALAAAEAMLSGEAFGAPGRRIVVEAFLDGEEASFIALCDGREALPLQSSQDHKALGDGDRGPNTGGMGAYSPAPVLGPAVHERVMREVITPALRGMAEEGHPYRGFLYAGLMIAPDGSPRVLEFNCRLGDPEAQVLLMRLCSDLVEPLEAALAGRLAGLAPDWDPRPALGVVLAAQGYPGSYRKGDVITGLRDLGDADTRIFHAGTVADAGGAVVTGGGRVACVCALGGTVGEAQRRAYERLSHVYFEGVYYRRDIGGRAVTRERVRS